MIRSKNQRFMLNIHHFHMEIQLRSDDLRPTCSKTVSRLSKIDIKRFEDDIQNIFTMQGIIAFAEAGFFITGQE